MTATNENRRAFLRGRVFRHSPTTIRLPWIKSFKHFSEKCSRCNDCIAACPEKILFVGDGGFPEINFTLGECSFCEECAKVCKEDVFQDAPRDDKNAWSVKASITSSCLSLNAILCRTCGDSCPSNAIRFHLKLGGVAEPEINVEDCTGCGACLYVCPENSVSLRNL